MTEQMPEEPDPHYANARSWALDRADALARWARTGWIVAGIAITVAALEGLALAAIAPLKTVQREHIINFSLYTLDLGQVYLSTEFLFHVFCSSYIKYGC